MRIRVNVLNVWGCPALAVRSQEHQILTEVQASRAHVLRPKVAAGDEGYFRS